MSLNLLFLLHKKSVFRKKVTKSRIVTKSTVTKSRFDCTYSRVTEIYDLAWIDLNNKIASKQPLIKTEQNKLTFNLSGNTINKLNHQQKL